MTSKAERAQKIAALNDAFRRGERPELGRIMVTSGINDKGEQFVMAAVGMVRSFDAFSEDNDPHGEHDFGAFDLEGERVFWKLDYYGKDLESGSEDPADPAATTRVLTIMLASEY